MSTEWMLLTEIQIKSLLSQLLKLPEAFILLKHKDAVLQLHLEDQILELMGECSKGVSK
jgi:hypothetical protein